MNGPGDIPLTQTATTSTDRPCGLVSVIPSIGMSSCRGRAEAFARKLQSKLRTLGSQSDEHTSSQEEEPIINGNTSNTWLPPSETEQTVTALQPLRQESESYFDFDCDLESPGSPAEECEYLRLIESASNTSHTSASESGYACNSMLSSHSSSSVSAYFEPESTENSEPQAVQVKQPRPSGIVECIKPASFENSQTSSITNGHETENEYESACNELPTESSASESLPPSQDSLDTEQQSDIETAKDISEIVIEEILQHNLVAQNGHNITTTDTEGIKLSLLIPKIETDQAVEETPVTDTEVKNNKLVESTKNNLEPASNDTKNKLSSVLDTDDDEDDCRPQRVRRCSSLKTGKTPPGTPSRKKIVRFADALGLDLADIKTFLDEVPTIPKSAFEDLEIVESEPPIQLGPKSDKFLMPLFQQPGGMPTFLDLVREKQVSLENAAVTDHINQTVTGTVRVKNLDFHKSVHIRYTIDDWRTYADLQATYLENSCDGFSDKFKFVLFGNSMHIGQRLEFAVRFQCKGQQFWDNNFGANYSFQCLPTLSSTNINPMPSVIPPFHTDCAIRGPPATEERWCGFY